MTTPPDVRERIYRHYVSAGQAGPVSEAVASRARYVDWLIARHFPTDREITGIDLGCGHGVILYCAQRAGYHKLTGVDVSAEQVEAARSLGVRNVRQADLWQALDGLESGSQDLAICFDVIEHLPKSELTRLVDGVRRALRPGGRWIINTPNGESPLFGRVRYGDLTHELAFTRQSLATLLLASGFERVDCYENEPIRSGLKGWVRWTLWKLIRAGLRLYLAAESGDTGRDAIFTQNLLAVAIR